MSHLFRRHRWSVVTVGYYNSIHTYRGRRTVGGEITLVTYKCTRPGCTASPRQQKFEGVLPRDLFERGKSVDQS